MNGSNLLESGLLSAFKQTAVVAQPGCGATWLQVSERLVALRLSSAATPERTVAGDPSARAPVSEGDRSI